VTYTLVESDEEKAILPGVSLRMNSVDERAVQPKPPFNIHGPDTEKGTMTFADVIRQWNYVEGIVGYNKMSGKQNTKLPGTECVRSKYYATAVTL